MTPPDRQRVQDALHDAEHGTTGTIAIRFVPDKEVDALARAIQEFERAGLHRHEHRNAAAILVAPKARQFAVIGDEALHARVGEAFWTGTIEAMQPRFSEADIPGALMVGLERLGIELKRHFPA